MTATWKTLFAASTDPHHLPAKTPGLEPMSLGDGARQHPREGMKRQPGRSVGYLATLLVFGSALMVGGCAPDVAEIAGETDVQVEDIGFAEQAVTSGWTQYTSDGLAPATCGSGSVVQGFQCRGSFCDDIRGLCVPTGRTPGDLRWLTFSDENGWTLCPAGYGITGLACNGSFCDDVSIQCTFLAGLSQRNCVPTGWVSEEFGGFLPFPAGYYAAGAQCSGDYCDNMRFWICPI